MTIATEFLIDYTNKRIYHDAAVGTTVYSVNALYSMLMDTFDELGQMDDKEPMSAQTPTAYTMINGWFLDCGEGSYAHKYLNGGAIKTLGYALPTYSPGIRLLKMSATSWHTMIAGDIGKAVVYNDGTPTDTGTVVGYDNTLHYIWVRTANDFSTLEALKVDGSATSALLSAGITGEELWANVYTLGSIESAPYAQIYIFQNSERVGEWSSLTNFDRGHIDILIEVKQVGVEIDGANITVFNRQSGDLYAHYTIDLTDGGRNAVPLATGADGNQTTGEHYLLYDGEVAAPVVGDIIVGATSGAYGELVAITDWGSSGLLTFKGVRGAFTDGENLQVSSVTKCVANGTLGDTYLVYDASTVTPSTLGQVMTGGTSTAKRLLRGIQHDAPGGKMVCQVDDSVFTTTRKAHHRTFTDNELVTGATTGSVTLSADSITLVSGYSDITVAFVNGTITTGGITGTYIIGERVTWNTSQHAYVVKVSGSTLTLANATSTTINTYAVVGDLSGATATASQNLQSAYYAGFAFTQQAEYNYSVFIQGGSIYNDTSAGRSLLQIYNYLKYITRDGSTLPMYTVVAGVITQLDGQEYIQAYTGFTPIVAAPFGTYAGGSFYGAQGVWIQGMLAANANNVTFRDTGYTERTPYQSIVISVGSLVSGDRVLVVQAVSSVITTNMYTSDNTANVAGDNTFVLTEDIDIDIPSDGTIRVRHVEGHEYRYRYVSWSGKTFTFPTEKSAQADAGGSGTLLIDAAATFLTDDIEYGDIIRNETDGSWAYVVSVDSNTQITTTQLQGGGDNTWSAGDTFSTNTIQETCVVADTVYVPYIDAMSAGTSVSVNVLYDATKEVLVRVRKKGIQPFETPSSVSTAGMTVSAIRTPDTIVQ